MSINLKLSTYVVEVTNTQTGEDGTVEVEALDLGDALAKVEAGGVFAANDGRLLDEAPSGC